MIALGGPKLKLEAQKHQYASSRVSMIALGGPKLKRSLTYSARSSCPVSMIALGGPKLKLAQYAKLLSLSSSFNDSTGWA